MNRPQKYSSFIKNLNYLHVDADDIGLLETTSEFREKILSLIAQANQRIYITALYLQDDEAGHEVLQAIYEAKQKNPKLDAKIFVDFLRAQRGLMGHAESIGNVRLYREMAEKYEHKVEILGVPVKTREVLGVLHLKGFVFDDTLLYSGASINNVYLQQAERYRYDRYHTIDHAPLTDSFVNYLNNYLYKARAVKSLNQSSVPVIKSLKQQVQRLKKALRSSEYHYQTTQEALGKQQVAVTPLIGFGGRKNELNRTIFEMVKFAQQKVVIYTPYFNLPNAISKTVRRLVKKGKAVEIIVGDKTANDFFIPEGEPFSKIGIIPYVYETNLRKFVKQNQKFIDSGILKVNLWRHDYNSFHLKGVSCDDSVYLLTGHNLNPRACRLDLENGILIQDPDSLLKEKFEREHQMILTHTIPVRHFTEIEEIKDYPEAAFKLIRSVKRAKLDSILNRLL